MGIRVKEKTEIGHSHLWKSSFDASEMKCDCGAILVSEIERDRRIKEWEDYYAKVYESRAYKRFIEQKEAFKRGQMQVVKALAEEAKNDRLTKTDWIPKPHFPDPSIGSFYVLSAPEDTDFTAVQKLFNG